MRWFLVAMSVLGLGCQSLQPVEISSSSEEILEFDESEFPLTKEEYHALDVPTRGLVNYLLLLQKERRLSTIVDERPVLGGTRWHIQEISINDAVGRSVSIGFEDGHYEKTLHFIYQKKTKRWLKIGSNTTAQPVPVLELSHGGK